MVFVNLQLKIKKGLESEFIDELNVLLKETSARIAKIFCMCTRIVSVPSVYAYTYVRMYICTYVRTSYVRM